MKITLTQVPVFSLAFIRMFSASIILVFFISKKLKIEKQDFGAMIFAALSGVTFNLAFFFVGLKYTEAINAAFLVAAVPIFTIIAAFFFLKEKLTVRLAIASLVAFLGVILIIGKPFVNQDFSQLLGNILLLISAMFWIIHEIISKKLLKKYDGAVVAFYSMAIGAVTFLPFFLWEFFKNPSWFDNVSFSGGFGILYGIIFASLIAYIAWQKGLSKLGAGEASFFFYLDPISGAALSILLLGEKVSSNLIVGGLFIAVAVFLAEFHRRSHLLHN